MSSELITLQCPNCGGRLNVNTNTTFLKCDNCGIEHIVKRSSDGVFLESFAKCPLCNRNDKSEKVSSIIRSQIQKSETLTYQTRITYKTGLHQRVPVEEHVAVPIQTIQITDLAKQLKAPEKPIVDISVSNIGNNVSLLFIIIGLILGLMTICCGIPYAMSTINSKIPSEQGNDLLKSIILISFLLCFSVLPLIFGILLNRFYLPNEIRKNNEKIEAGKTTIKIWEDAMSRYNKLYYCQRDDCVFVQGENVAVPITKMQEILYKQ